MFSTLQDNAEIKSTACMIILSIIPSDLVRTGALLLGGTIVISHSVHAIRPRDLMENLQKRLLCAEEKLKAAIDSGIMAQADANATAQIERRFGNVFELQERTLLMSGVLQEIQAVWRGQSFEIYKCLEDVKALEKELEIHRATVMKNRYYWWK
ncbi:hypothetical protein K443DRAFT_8877 [Laccaria amethystina LaAM-08-1]|uniref:Uncharacterized protein n=1 Tax=Laccaria amethystina LaAM-08-1 TaxID=1095629 RepID=A0A0C9XSH3_9AGAR|nr:hypothetical protein K443DRAFT_8877 [Laccaria amethystina LaAM-08-1]